MIRVGVDSHLDPMLVKNVRYLQNKSNARKWMWLLRDPRVNMFLIQVILEKRNKRIQTEVFLRKTHKPYSPTKGK